MSNKNYRIQYRNSKGHFCDQNDRDVEKIVIKVDPHFNFCEFVFSLDDNGHALECDKLIMALNSTFEAGRADKVLEIKRVLS